MKRLGIISTQIMPWGGSEEIWAEVALAARRRGIAVRANVTENCRGVRRVTELSAAGVEFTFRRESPTQLGLPQRAINWARRGLSVPPPAPRPEGKWAEAFTPHPDALLICQGGAYCGTGLPGLTAWLQQTRIPHGVLCQSARSQWPVDEGLRARARAYFAGAAWVGFASLGNRQEIQVQLADPIRNHRVFQNPIAFSPAEEVPWVKSATPLLSCPARFNVGDKGQDLFLQVLAQPAWRSREFRCVLFGGGPDEAYLRRLVDYLELGQRVTFGGETHGTRPIWEQTQLMILPSRSEGLSLVLLEAMAAGRAIVTTAVGGHAEWLRDGQDGFVAATPSVPALAEALERAWAAQAQWPAIGQSARGRFLALYDPDPVATMLGLLEAMSSSPAQ